MTGKYIVVLGSLNMDLVMLTERMPVAGETIRGTAFTSRAGGKGLNQAVACHRLLPEDGEWKTYMVGRVGDDEFSEKLRRELQSEGIDVSEVKTAEGKSSGVAVILAFTHLSSRLIQVESPTGENRIILSAKDANESFTPDQLTPLTPLIRSAAILICQLEIPLETVHEALRIAHSAGVPTILNPAPAQPHLPPEIYPLVDYLIPNESEAECLLGPNYEVDSPAAALDAACVLMSRGVRKAVIITLGHRGIVLYKNNGQIRMFPARAVPKVVDSTGAGDCFIGGVAVALAERGLAVEGACHVGLATAAVAVQRRGARDSMPYRREMAWAGN
jgi:ribokinase